MATKRHKLGWIEQGLIVGLGSMIGAVFGLALAGPDMGVGDSGLHRIQSWCIASCGAVAGGLLFSWAKDR